MHKTALITGGARGIGRAITIGLAKQGWQVVINYHTSEQAAKELAAQLQAEGCSALAVQADVADRAQVQAMLQMAKDRFGGIDLLVNNAGVAQQKLFTDITDNDWRRMMGINLDGVFHCTQAVLGGMIARKSGCIINISSIWGMVGASCEVHYSAAKAAVIGMTKALAKELGPSGIRVNCIAPGVIDTDMNQELDAETMEWLKQETPLGVIGTAEDVAKLAVFLASEEARFITGQVISPNGGFVI